MQEILLKIRYFEKGLSNILKKVNFIFPFKPSPFYWMKLSKTKAVWKRWPITLQVTKPVQKNSFIRYILSDQVWWCNVKQFLSYSKITSTNFCKPIHDISNYSTCICVFESGKCAKEGKKLQEFEYFENEKSFSDEIKKTFFSF